MILGRDCIQVQKNLQYITSEDKHQLAIQTPLGWTIMGKPATFTSPLQVLTSSYFTRTEENDPIELDAVNQPNKDIFTFAPP